MNTVNIVKEYHEHDCHYWHSDPEKVNFDEIADDDLFETVKNTNLLVLNEIEIDGQQFFQVQRHPSVPHLTGFQTLCVYYQQFQYLTKTYVDETFDFAISWDVAMNLARGGVYNMPFKKAF